LFIRRADKLSNWFWVYNSGSTKWGRGYRVGNRVLGGYYIAGRDDVSIFDGLNESYFKTFFCATTLRVYSNLKQYKVY